MNQPLDEGSTTIRPASPGGPIAMPPSVAAATAAQHAGDDQNFALSLRLLTVLVLAALGGSIAFLAYRSLTPASLGTGPGVVRDMKPPMPVPDARSAGNAKPADEVLMAPNRVFRCEERGRVTFSDEACTDGKPDHH